MQNQHINQFLDYYSGLPNPQYAILLKGKWGSGKTYFINEYKKHLEEKNQKYIYVSLYGVTKYDEIETKFLESIYPRLYNKKTIFAGKIAKQLLKGTLKIDLDYDGKADGNVSIQIPNFKPEDLLNTKDHILIFDDLERCSIKIIDLLGYINYFVEHQSYKVILIANEEELEKTEKYKEIKEKLVGKTFEFKTNANLAYDSFLSELKNTNKVKENILEKEKSNILELFEKSKSNNLRALRQSLLDFERFYDEILITHLAKEELAKDVLYWFFLFSFEIRQGNSDILDLPKLSEEYHELLIVDKKEDEAEKTKYKLLLNKYNLYNYSDAIISFDSWKEVLLNSNIKQKEINLALKNSQYYFDENTPSWKILTQFQKLEDDEFEKLLQDVYKKFCDNEYKDYKHFKLVASMLLSFQELNLLKITFEELFILIKKNFNSLFEKNFIIIKDILFSKNKFMDDKSYENSPYIESSSFQELLKYIDDFASNKKSVILKYESETIINAIKEQNHNKLFELLEGKNDIRIIDYKDKPILSQINTDDLFNALMKTNGVTMHYFGGIIKDRYNNRTKELLDEEAFLKELLGKINNYLQNNEVKVSTYNLKKEIKANIEIALRVISNVQN
ncbi:P-loop NTPase fold protein [Arcobacter sp. FWKO B]|uniref:P-loop NTPase fold protein n=1 Tax=Arcobacter sp. FWKO B TaxID=2593672 RepID=UPI0018A4B2C1|nr:P-loop NTPase fold protein [Arcobacter sp. FWKO B]QOG12798.1 hypothetical protein FWKOB_08865 [Arcobacter sp. FWKO B]